MRSRPNTFISRQRDRTLMSAARVRTALVDSDFLGHAAQADGAREERACCAILALGAQQKADRVTVPVNRPVQVPLLAGGLDAALILWLTVACWPLAPAKRYRKHRLHRQGPEMQYEMIDKDARRRRHLFNVMNRCVHKL